MCFYFIFLIVIIMLYTTFLIFLLSHLVDMALLMEVRSRGGQNPPDPSNPNRPAPIRANFVSFFAGSGWELRNPVGSVRVAGLGKFSCG